MKIYKKGLIFFFGRDSKRYQKSFAKAGKGISTIANASFYFNASQYSGAIRTCRKYVSPQTDK